jgi:heme/copper-type cytochrome/quinol oxidase subunit 3
MINLIVGTEAMFFLCLIMAFIYMAFHSGFEPHELNKLNIRTSGMYTILLIASSFSMLLAERSLRYGKIGGLKGWLLITIFLGTTFLFGQGKEYVRLIRENITLSGSVFGTSFFTLTGFHGLHVFIGLIVLSVILLLIFLGDYSQSSPVAKVGKQHTALNTAAIYWHFVDIVWIIVFTVVYVLPKFTDI